MGFVSVCGRWALSPKLRGPEVSALRFGNWALPSPAKAKDKAALEERSSMELLHLSWLYLAKWTSSWNTYPKPLKKSET